MMRKTRLLTRSLFSLIMVLTLVIYGCESPSVLNQTPELPLATAEPADLVQFGNETLSSATPLINSAQEPSMATWEKRCGQPQRVSPNDETLPYEIVGYLFGEGYKILEKDLSLSRLKVDNDARQLGVSPDGRWISYQSAILLDNHSIEPQSLVFYSASEGNTYTIPWEESWGRFLSWFNNDYVGVIEEDEAGLRVILERV